MIVAVVFSLLMFTPADLVNHMEFMITDGVSKCLIFKREAERNTNPDRIKWICKQVKAEIEIDSTGKLHINKLIKE